MERYFSVGIGGNGFEKFARDFVGSGWIMVGVFGCGSIRTGPLLERQYILLYGAAKNLIQRLWLLLRIVD